MAGDLSTIENVLYEASRPRRRILRAAQKVLGARKVSGTRMREIALCAGISLGTLNYYYPSKTGLLLAVLDEMQNFFESRKPQLLAGDLNVSDRLRLFARQQLSLLEEMPQVEEVFLDFWGHAQVDPVIREKIRAMYRSWRRDMSLALQPGLESGECDPDEARLVPYLYVAMLEGLALQFLLDTPPVTPAEAFDAAHRAVLRLLQGNAAPLPEAAVEPGAAYPSDIGDAEWERIEPLLAPPRPGGRPRSVDLRAVVNALRYIQAARIPWRMLPHDFPGWQTVYAYHARWAADGTLEAIREAAGLSFEKLGQDPPDGGR